MDPALFHILALAALNGVSTGYFIHGRQQERRLNDKRLLVQELTERRELEDRYSILRPEYERWVKPDPEPDGGVPMILAGTGGTSLGQQEAVEACRASADGSYGPILLAEPNNDSRRRYLQAVAQLLGWRGKVIEETFPRCPGFQGRTPTKALHPSFLPSLLGT